LPVGAGAGAGGGARPPSQAFKVRTSIAIAARRFIRVLWFLGGRLIGETQAL